MRVDETKNSRSVGRKSRSRSKDLFKRRVEPESLLPSLFPGDGEMALRMRAMDWSKTAVGPIEFWPQSLKTALSICLASRFPMFIWWGRDLTVFYNDAYIPFAGSTKHPRYLGRPAREQWEEIWDQLEPLTKHVFESGTATWAESMQLFMTRQGFLEETYFTFSYSPVRDETGAVGGIINPCQETTERILSERRLKTLHDLSVQVMKSIEDVGESAARILAGNPHDVPFALVYVTKETRAKLIGAAGIAAASQAAPESIDLQFTQPGTWPVAEIARSHKPMKIAHLRALFPADLPPFPYEEGPDAAYILPLEYAGQDRPVGFLILGTSPRLVFDERYQGFFDLVGKHISNHMANVLALEEEKKRTESFAEIDRAKTTFFSNVSHEFRTPLTLILGPLEDMLRQDLSRVQRDQLTMAHRNSLRLLKLVNTLLDFARIEAARVQVSYEPTDLSSLTVDLASAFRSAIEQAGMKLSVHCPPLPEAIFVDRDMWEKIVLNLLSNAFKFTFEGEISVTLEDLGDSVALVVSDSGTGIPEAELPHMFDRFHRVPNARARTHEGTGIGLALVKELVKYHCGSLSVQSVVDKGTSFTVMIPMGSAHLPRDRVSTRRPAHARALRQAPYVEEALRWLPENRSASSREGQDVSLRGSTGLPLACSRVLVVDDNADMRDYVQALLSQRWTVEAFGDGEAALQAAFERPPDLVLSDVMMPHIDGFELLHRLRSHPKTREVPVILLSARSGEEARVEGMAAGADDYLIKPFSARELFARVQAHLELARQRQELNRVLREAKEQLQSANEILERRVEERTEALRLALEDLAKEKFQLERSNKELEQFAGVAAHDLRAPLKSMRSWVDILDLSIPSPRSEEIDEAIGFINHNTKKAEAFVEDLLEVARVNVSRAHFESVDLDAMLQGISSVFREEIEAKGAKIIWARLPEVRGNPIHFESLFSNLIQNALTYRDKSRMPEIAIGYRDLPDFYEFSISDNGIGIDARYRERIFEMFIRLHGEKEYPGTGIGLAYCKKVVELSGGRIWVNSVPGEGSTFFFTYPRNPGGTRGEA